MKVETVENTLFLEGLLMNGGSGLGSVLPLLVIIWAIYNCDIDLKVLLII